MPIIHFSLAFTGNAILNTTWKSWFKLELWCLELLFQVSAVGAPYSMGRTKDWRWKRGVARELRCTAIGRSPVTWPACNSHHRCQLREMMWDSFIFWYIVDGKPRLIVRCSQLRADLPLLKSCASCRISFSRLFFTSSVIASVVFFKLTATHFEPSILANRTKSDKWICLLANSVLPLQWNSFQKSKMNKQLEWTKFKVKATEQERCRYWNLLLIFHK